MKVFLFLSELGRPPQPPKRDPRTTLSVGRARARSMVAGLTEMGKSNARKTSTLTFFVDLWNERNALRLVFWHFLFFFFVCSFRRPPPLAAFFNFINVGAESNRSSTGSGEEIYSNSTSRTASIRSRSGSGRVSSSDLERLSAPTAVAPPAPPSQQRTPRVYASVAEMKRMKVRWGLDTVRAPLFFSTWLFSRCTLKCGNVQIMECGWRKYANATLWNQKMC